MQTHGVFSYVYSIGKENDMKNVYIVRGSEDGIIGVYSNKKSAMACAKDYAGGVVDEMKDYGHSITLWGEHAYAEVDIWPVEKSFQ